MTNKSADEVRDEASDGGELVEGGRAVLQGAMLLRVADEVFKDRQGDTVVWRSAVVMVGAEAVSCSVAKGVIVGGGLPAVYETMEVQPRAVRGVGGVPELRYKILALGVRVGS